MALDCKTTTDVTTALCLAITELNLHLPKHERLKADPSTPLFGNEGGLDSLGLANFIILVEDKLEEAVGIRLDLTEDDPFSPETGHFRTLGSLAQHIHAILDGRSRE